MEGTSQPDNRIRWTAKCTDPYGRQREVRVGIEDGKVFTIVPAPGEGFSMTKSENRTLIGIYEAAERFL